MKAWQSPRPIKVTLQGAVARRTGRREYCRVGPTAASLLPTPVQQVTLPRLIFYFHSKRQ